MATPTATVDDVDDTIATGLSDPDIRDSLDNAAELNAEFNDTTAQTARQTRQIEKWAAIIEIRQFKERSVSEDSVGGASSTFEGDELARARAQLRTWLVKSGGDVSMLNAFDTVIRDTSRNVYTSDRSQA